MPLHHAICDFESGNEEISIRVYSEISLVYVFWKKHAGGESFREAFTAGFEQVRQRGLHYWLSDSRALNYAHVSDQHWVAGEVGNFLAHSTLLKMAHVVPDDAIRTLIAFQLADKLKEKLQGSAKKIEVFSNLDHALFWLNLD